MERPELLTDETVRCDYVYSYPPRQAYRRLPEANSASEIIAQSITSDARTSLYLHFPFCGQACSFCNLYSTIQDDAEVFRDYVSLIEREVALRAPSAPQLEVRTVYLGGGTPSLLSAQLLNRVLVHLQQQLNFDVGSVPEVAMEVSPDTATAAYLESLRSIGITRINLGMQTASASELRTIGRKYGLDVNRCAIEAALAAGFDNVCVDLIFGLPEQSEQSWISSLEWIVERKPQTVCAYPLTVRKGTRFGRDTQTDPFTQYRRYDLANQLLSSAGYEQETHVRWILPGQGGYLQKQYHWGGENLLGFGAGARSYVREADLRNGYSLRPRRRALDVYSDRIQRGIDPAVEGFDMDASERRRKSVVLGILSLSGNNFRSVHGVAPSDVFPSEFKLLVELGLGEWRGIDFHLTPKGVRHRDVIVQLFFSPRVLELIEAYDYSD